VRNRDDRRNSTGKIETIDDETQRVKDKRRYSTCKYSVEVESLLEGKIDSESTKVVGETPFLSVVRYCGTIVRYSGGRHLKLSVTVWAARPTSVLTSRLDKQQACVRYCETFVRYG